MILLDPQDITRTRRKSGSVGSDGRRSPTTVGTTTITASVQPADGQDLQQLPERERSREVKKVYTDADLRVADPRSDELADHLTIGGVDYEVSHVESYDDLLAHDYALAVRLQE